jgi:two-component sensor histidine kinase
VLQRDAVDALVLATVVPRGERRLLLVSGVDSSVTRDFLQGIVTRRGDAASLMRADGLLMIRNFDAEPMMLPPDARIRVEMVKGDVGSFTTVAASDGVERLYAFHKLTGLPIYANFGTPTRIVLVDWLRRAMPVWALLAALAVFLLLAEWRAERRVVELFELEAGRKRAEEAERLAEARTHLMRETNHRVKNNLALVVSLINMQMRGKAGVDGAQLKARIGAISRVHDLMYQAADGVHVDFAQTLRELAESPAIVPQERGIAVDCRVEQGTVVLGPDQLTPLAVIAAELLTNAVKHAFRGREQGVIRVSLARTGSDGLLEVSDDGVGLPGDPQRRSGMAIVDALVAQIGGSIERVPGPGAVMRVRFPLPAA